MNIFKIISDLHEEASTDNSVVSSALTNSLELAVAHYEICDDMGIAHITHPNFAVYRETMEESIRELKAEEFVMDLAADFMIAMMDISTALPEPVRETAFGPGKLNTDKLTIELYQEPSTESETTLIESEEELLEVTVASIVYRYTDGDSAVIQLYVDGIQSDNYVIALVDTLTDVFPLSGITLNSKCVSDLEHVPADGIQDYVAGKEGSAEKGLLEVFTTESDSLLDTLGLVKGLLTKYPNATVKVDGDQEFTADDFDEDSDEPESYLSRVADFALTVSDDNLHVFYSKPEGINEITALEAIRIMTTIKPKLTVEWPGMGTFKYEG